MHLMDFAALAFGALAISLHLINLYPLSTISILISGNVGGVSLALKNIPLIRIIRARLEPVELYLSLLRTSSDPEQLVPTGQSPREVYENLEPESKVMPYPVFLELYNIQKLRGTSSREKICKSLRLHLQASLIFTLLWILLVETYLLANGMSNGADLIYYGLIPAVNFALFFPMVSSIVTIRVFFVKLLWKFGYGRLAYSLAALLDG